MGLLDALFAPDNYGGGSILGLIRNSAQNQQFGSGLQSDRAQYDSPMNAMAQSPILPQNYAGPTPLDNAQWPAGPVGAPSQPNAQIPQQPSVIQAQPSQPQGGPGIGDRLNAGLQGFANSGGVLPAIANGIGGLMSGQRTDPTGIAQQQLAQSQNLTQRWLQQRGVDPVAAQAAIANPEVLKSLIEQLKPKTPMNIGSGYIYEPDTKKATRLYEPEDKIPAGFAKGEDGNMKYIPGGPADPAYIQLAEAKKKDPNGVYTLGRGGELYKIDAKGNPVIVHKNEADQPEATLDDPTVSAMAGQYLAGDRTVMQNLGRGAQGAANIVKLRTEIYKQAQSKGLDGVGIVDNFNEQAGAVAGQRAVGTRAANISLAANEANNMIDVAVKASLAVPRTQYVPINKAIQMVQTGSSSPQLASFVAATNSLVNAYVRAVSPSGVPTDSMREHAYSMLNSAQSHEAYMSVIGTMRKEMDAALKAPGQVREELRRTKTEGSAKPEPIKIDGYTITAH